MELTLVSMSFLFLVYAEGNVVYLKRNKTNRLFCYVVVSVTLTVRKSDSDATHTSTRETRGDVSRVSAVALHAAGGCNTTCTQI